MKKSSICLLAGLVLVWGALEFKFLIAPRLSDQGVRATIEKCVYERYGGQVLWEVNGPILFKSPTDSPVAGPKAKEISASAMRARIKSTYEGVDLVHLKQGQGSECRFFFEDIEEDALRFVPSDGPPARYLEEGAEINDGEIHLHFHQGKFFRVYADGHMSSFSIFGLRNLFPFWEVQLVYPQYLASKLVPYLWWLGLVLAAISAVFKAGCYFKGRIGSGLRSKLKSPPQQQERASPPELFLQKRSRGDSLPENTLDTLAPGKSLVSFPSPLIQENRGNDDKAVLAQKSLRPPPSPPSQEKIERAIIKKLESLKRKAHAEAVRIELAAMLLEMYSGRQGVSGARLFLRKAQALTQTSAEIKPTIKPTPKHPMAKAHRCLPSLSGEDIVSVLAKVGYRYERDSRHHFFLKCAGRRSVSVPNHDDIHPNRLRGILRKTGISPQKFNELLQ